MKKFSLLVCLISLSLVALFLTTPLVVFSASAPDSKPAIYEFARKLCPICQKNAMVLKEVEARYRGQIILRFLYIDTEEPVFREYRVTFVPTQVFLDASGREVFRHEGPLSQKELIAKLKELNFVRD